VEFAARSDGNCVCSPDVLETIREEFLRCTGEEDDGRPATPMQIRYLSMKGVLVADPALPRNTLHYNCSQKKYELQFRRATETQRRIEVCGFARDSKSARLNIQIIVALEARMKRPELLGELLTKQLHSYSLALTDPHAADKVIDKDLGAYSTPSLEWFVHH
jgi:hypothetical protein